MPKQLSNAKHSITKGQILSIQDTGEEINEKEIMNAEHLEGSLFVKKSATYRKSKERHAIKQDIFGADLYAHNESRDSWQLASLYSECLYENFVNSDDVIELHNTNNIQTKMGSAEGVLCWAFSLLSISPTARILVSESAKDGWKIALEDLDGPDFHLDVPDKKIILNRGELSEHALARSNYFSSILVISLIRALRDVWQEKRNGAFDEDYTPESILTLERVRAADLDVIAVLVAWELRCEGYNNLWRHILGSEDSDLAMRFSGYLERNPSSAFTHKALAATFSQWFRCETRISVCDHEALDYMDRVLATSDMQNPFGKGKVQKIDIERLSCLPDKTAYLQHDASTILADPLYAGMNDEINQSHLMHILYDTKVTLVQNVPFRNFDLAERIFPGGMMSSDECEVIQ